MRVEIKGQARRELFLATDDSHGKPRHGYKIRAQATIVVPTMKRITVNIIPDTRGIVASGQDSKVDSATWTKLR